MLNEIILIDRSESIEQSDSALPGYRGVCWTPYSIASKPRLIRRCANPLESPSYWRFFDHVIVKSHFWGTFVRERIMQLYAIAAACSNDVAVSEAGQKLLEFFGTSLDDAHELLEQYHSFLHKVAALWITEAEPEESFEEAINVSSYDFSYLLPHFATSPPRHFIDYLKSDVKSRVDRLVCQQQLRRCTISLRPPRTAPAAVLPLRI